MHGNHATLSKDYLQTIQSVLNSGKSLRRLLDADTSTQHFAIGQLEEAAQQNAGRAQGYQAFMFTELEATAEKERPKRERLTEDSLAMALTDLQVANVLIAGGLTTGELGKKEDPRLLDEALRKLENTKQAVETYLVNPLDRDLEPGRFGFAGEAPSPTKTNSDNLSDALETLSSRSEETLKTLVDEAKSVVTVIYSGLENMKDKNLIQTALSQLGTRFQALSGVARLIRWGLEKLKQALNALLDLLGTDALGRVKDKINEFFKKMNVGEYIAEVLEWAFGFEDTRKQILVLTQVPPPQTDLKKEQVDDATDELVTLDITYKDNMAMAKSLVSGVKWCGAVLALTPLAGPNLALLTASAYVLILAGVILIGMDYADSGVELRRVRGVKEIIQTIIKK